MNMKKWVEDLRTADVKKTMPILSFPSVSLMGITVKELINDPDLQAKGMKAVADEIDSAASVSMMDLSIEAEAFGAKIQMSEDEVPTILGALISTEEEAEAVAELDEMILIARCHTPNFSYATIKKWFLRKFPEVAEFGTIEAEYKAQFAI